jgi:hypothetical protein
MVDRRVWFSRRAMALHAVIVVVVPTFIGLCVWQVERALSGNGLSWAYVFEWPFFAGYAVYMWWRFLHEPVEGQEEPVRRGGAATGRSGGGAGDPATEAESEELAAYNEYLGELAERGKPKRWR